MRYLRHTETGDVVTVSEDDDAQWRDLTAQRESDGSPSYEQISESQVDLADASAGVIEHELTDLIEGESNFSSDGLFAVCQDHIVTFDGTLTIADGADSGELVLTLPDIISPKRENLYPIVEVEANDFGLLKIQTDGDVLYWAGGPGTYTLTGVAVIDPWSGR